MRENKWTILLVAPVSFVALLAAGLCEIQEDTFLSNVMLGVFGSGLLTVMVSTINYWTMRRRTLEAFWSYGLKVVRCFNRYSASDDLDNRIRELLEIADYDYQPFDDAYGDICFLFHEKKKRQELAERIYGPIMGVRNTIGERAHHFREYTKAENSNRLTMKALIREIEPCLIERVKYLVPDESGREIECTSITPYMVMKLYKEFNDYFYWIMYPWMKKENDNAH